MMDAMDMEEEDVEDEETSSAERSALEEAFPDQEWTGERVAAMKEFVRLCTEDGYADEEEPGAKKKGKMGGPGLALIFGKEK